MNDTLLLSRHSCPGWIGSRRRGRAVRPGRVNAAPSPTVPRSPDPGATVDQLVAALMDLPLAEIDPVLAQLRSACRQTRRYREAIPVFQRIAAADPTRKHEMAAEVALVHAHLGEHADGLAVLGKALAQHRRLPVARRSAAFGVAAEFAAIALGDAAAARDAALLWRSIAYAGSIGLKPAV